MMRSIINRVGKGLTPAVRKDLPQVVRKGLPLEPTNFISTIFNFNNSSRSLQNNQIPTDAVSRGAMPTGAMLPGAMPPGAMPPGAMPPGAMPTGAMPTGAMPTGAMPTGAMPTGAMPTGATTTVEIPTSGSVPTTPNDFLKFMKDNNITIEDLQKITNDEKIVKTTEQAVEQAFVNQPSVDWKEMRNMQNQVYQAFNKINVFKQAWKKFVEDECNTRSSEEQDKCFAIRGFVYVSFMVFLIILKMVDSHNKKVKISDSELVNVVNTVVSGLVVDRILPSQLQNVITERVNQLLLKQKIIDNQVRLAVEKIN
jgi:hypothetical protein